MPVATSQLQGAELRVLIATSSEGKRRELEGLARTLLPGRSVRVLSAQAFGIALPQIVEDAADFAGNAVLKAHGFRRWVLANRIEVDRIVADDSGLCVDVLDGRPGVHSARFSGLAGDDPDLDAANNRRLVDELQARGVDESAAQYRCALACVRIDREGLGEAVPVVDEVTVVEGSCRGIASVRARGSGGFGYDPHIWLEHRRQTFAELSSEEKGLLSHRGDAIRKLIASGALGSPLEVVSPSAPPRC